MFKKLLHKIVGDPTDKLLNSLQPSVQQVAALEPEIEQLSDDALRAKTGEFRERLEAGESLDDLLPEAFAVVREASRRTTGLRHYDVQIMGGILLHRGEVVEMRTGEGKTLVATLPLYLNALSGRGAHLVTVNEYLARRDGGWMGKIYHLLGLTVGVIGPQQLSALFDPDYVHPGAELEDERLVHWRPCTRRQAYRADITYGIASEFGFDYLRDNMVKHPDELVQRELHYAIIDEVDNVLIDEARTPLIISGPAPETGKEYQRFAQYVRGLRENTAEEEEEPNGHYDIDHKSRSITLTESGIAEIEQRIPEIDVEAGDSLYDPRYYELTYYLENALKAQYLFHRDREYVVQNGEVIIVDDSTGRLMPGRRYSDGLHEAIEAKENVAIKRETITVATITLQNYFRLYDKLAGMTGTAVTDAEEFAEIYELDVTPLPTNVEYIVENELMPLEEERERLDGAVAVRYVEPDTSRPVFFQRIDFPDQVYSRAEAKDAAIIREVKRTHESGRPVLVGTTSVEHSETIHRHLQREGIPHSVLNAKIHQSEALIVAQAGRKGAVTISTNMAGRGTDILLGGNPEGLTAEALEKEMLDRRLLTELASKLVEEGKDAAMEMARKHPKLEPDLVDALAETLEKFDAALSEIEEAQVAGYLARSLQEPYQLDFNDALHVIRLVRSGRLNAAREFLDERDKDIALVEEVVRLFGLYSRYQQIHEDKRQVAQFLAEIVFEEHYNARAALIRAVLNKEEDEAQRLVQTIPGLHQGIIDRINAIVEQARRERREVWELGGLHVVGSERHESRRIDNQLRGRAARQGDPGSSRFFLSLEDDLMRRFGGERLRRLMDSINVDDMPIENSVLDRLIESSQQRIEGYNFDIRKNLVEYDDVMNRQRQAIYDERREILLSKELDLDAKVERAFEAVIGELVQNYIVDYPGYVQSEIDRAFTDYTVELTGDLNIQGIQARLRTLLPGVMSFDRDELARLSPDRLSQRLMALAHENVESGQNLYQLVQAMGRFLPLLPPVPNLGAILSVRRSGQLQTRENLRRQFVDQVERLHADFLVDVTTQDGASQLPQDGPASSGVWDRAKARIDDAFSSFGVEGLSMDALRNQQNGFREAVEEALRDLLVESLEALDDEELLSALVAYTATQRLRWRRQIGEESYNDFLRLLLLSAIDREWRDYLTAMDDLRREVGLEAIAQRDPKVEYKRRSFQMFADMRANIDKDVADRFFRQIASHQAFIQRQEAAVAYRLTADGSAASDGRSGGNQRSVVSGQRAGASLVGTDMSKVGRNDPCPCGSGKKYKHCHLRQEQSQKGERARARG